MFGKEENIPLGIESIVKSLDNKYSKSGYSLKILEGHNDMNPIRALIRGEASKYPDRVTTLERVKQPELKQLFQESDIAIIAPGSTSAELAAIKGKKPKVVAMAPNMYPHFKENAKWLNLTGVTTEVMDEAQTLDSEHWAKVFNNLDAAPASTLKSTSANAGDINNILNTAKLDLSDEVAKTSRIGKLSALAGLVGTGLLGANYIKNERQKK